MRQLVGDDGVWLNEIEDGNVVDLLELFPPEGSAAEGLSIDVPQLEDLQPGPEDEAELAGQDGGDQPDVDDNDGDDAEQPGDS